MKFLIILLIPSLGFALTCDQVLIETSKLNEKARTMDSLAVQEVENLNKIMLHYAAI